MGKDDSGDLIVTTESGSVYVFSENGKGCRANPDVQIRSERFGVSPVQDPVLQLRCVPTVGEPMVMWNVTRSCPTVSTAVTEVTHS